MNRCQALLTSTKENGIAACIIAAASNRRYFAGFSGSNAMLFIEPSERRIITDFRYREQVKRQCPAFEAQIVERSGEIPAIAAAVTAANVKRVGFEANSVSYNLYKSLSEALAGIELVPIDAEISALRAVKSAEELERIQEAARITDAVFTDLIGFLKPGRTELEVAAFIDYRIKLLGADGPSFSTIVASGENAALPHHEPSGKELQNGDLVVMDFGAKFEGYCADMTRTVAIGSATNEQQGIYDLVLKAQLNALSLLRPGMTGREADAGARTIIEQAGYADNFGHGTGHGVGLDIHEAPTLNAKSEDVLKPGMTATIEPGVYIPGVGGVRIEDLTALTNTGAQNFTSSIKDFVVL